MNKKLLSLIASVPLAVMALHGQSPQTQTFNFTGGIQTFTVPCGVDTLFTQVWGAQGGSGATGNSSAGTTPGGAGANGGYAEGWLLVTPGDVINIFVGGQGGTPTAGFNGGGTGGSQDAGGGGGASDIRVGGTAEANRVITAGGGGGGGRGGCESMAAINGGDGGLGGGANGVNGIDAPTSGGAAGGGAGGLANGTGGAAGIGCGGFLGQPGANAVLGTGGTGGGGQACCCFSFSSIPGGGGGGGGQIGGGGGGGGSAGTTGCSGNDKGAGGGGGGGSSYTGGVLNGVTNNGIWLGNGQVTISFTDNIPTMPLAIIGMDVCIGQSGSFNIAPNAIATSYTWTVPADLTITSGQGTNSITVIATGMTGGNVTVTADNACGSSTPQTLAVNINPQPTVAATAASASICTGSSDVLTATGASTYAWSSGGSAATETVSPASSTIYSVVGTDANGCMDTATVMVTVNALPTVDLGTDITQCGGSVTLDAGNAGSTYIWSTTATTQTISVSTTGTYSVNVTDGNGCMNNDAIVVTINSLPTVTGTAAANTVCLNDAVVALTGTPSGGTWSGTGVTGSSFNPMTAGNGSHTATYTFTDANGCTNTATTVIVVNACVGIATNDILNSGVTLFPNPSNGTFTINVNGNVGDMTIEISDIEGRVVYSSFEKNVQAGFSKPVTLTGMPNGIYLVKLSANGSNATHQVTITK